MELPPALALLKGALNRLPGIGPRSAERLALFLVQSPQETITNLIDTIQEATSKIALCDSCGALTETQPCTLCSDPRRASGVLCIVVKPTDILNLERSHAFHGRYHVLGGQLSPINGIGPDDLAITPLEARIQQEAIQELILALGSDVEGDATSFYLAKRFAPLGVKVTRIAQGLPVGSDLDYADELTLGKALEGRKELPTT